MDLSPFNVVFSASSSLMRACNASVFLAVAVSPCPDRAAILEAEEGEPDIAESRFFVSATTPDAADFTPILVGREPLDVTVDPIPRDANVTGFVGLTGLVVVGAVGVVGLRTEVAPGVIVERRSLVAGFAVGDRVEEVPV